MDYIEKALKFLRSRTFAVILLMLIIISSFLTQVIPQKSFIGKSDYLKWKNNNPFLAQLFEFTSLDHILQSWWFKAVAIVLFISLLYCTYNRFRISFSSVRRKWVNRGIIQSYPFKVGILSRKKPEEIIKICRQILPENLYQIRYSHNLFYADKGGINKYASMIYHVALILIFLLVVLSRVTSMSGLVYITEGETIQESHNIYSELYEGPWFAEKHRGFYMALDKFQPEFQDGNPISYKSKLNLLGTDGTQEKLSIDMNQPVKYQGYAIRYIDYGYSPGLVIREKKGNEILNSYISIQNNSQGKSADTIEISKDIRLYIESYPDFQEINGKFIIKSPLIKKPAIYLEFYKNEKKLFNGLLKINQKKSIKDYEIIMDDMRYWVSYNIGYDPFISILFIVSILTALSIVLAILVNNPRFLGYITKKGDSYKLYLGAKPGGKMNFSRDFNKIVKEIRERLS